MKRFISIFSIFLILSFYINTLNAFAEPKTFTQGIYSARDSNLLVDTPITATITSSNDRVMIMIIDSNLNIRELIKLGGESTQHVLKPLSYDSSIVIFGNGSVTLS